MEAASTRLEFSEVTGKGARERACSRCGYVRRDVAMFAISDVLWTTERRLCPDCIARIRCDPLVVVEHCDEEANV